MVSQYTTVGVGVAGGVKFNLEFINADNPTANFEADVEAAALILSKALHNAITVNIAIGYGEVDGHALTNGSAAAGPSNGQTLTGSTVVAALISHMAAGDPNVSAFMSLTSYTAKIDVWSAQEKALGLISATGTALDGRAGFAVGIPDSLMVGVALHELTHALGRVPDIGDGNQDIFDLTRYTSPGHTLTDSKIPATAAYLSVDGGNTSLDSYGIGSDPSDFLNPSGSNAANALDPFNEYYSWSTLQTLTLLDLIAMDVSGFNTFNPATIAGAVAGQTTQREATLHPFSTVVISDPNAGATETLTITLSNAGAGGTLSGTGLAGGANGVYTLAGSAATVTAQLEALTFAPTAAAPNTTTKTTFTLSDQSSASTAPVVDATTTVTDIAGSSPTIAGTVAGQTTTREAAIHPFAAVVIGDANAGASDALTIALSNAGAGGTLSGAGLAGGAGGVYTLTGSAATMTAQLEALTFSPAAAAPNSSTTTTFTLSDVSSLCATATVNATTTVTDFSPSVAPTISGTVGGQITHNETPLKPFSGAAVVDANAGATDTLTIALSSGGAGGALSGAGLLGGAGGVYTLTGTAQAVTGALDALIFTPAVAGPNASVTTTFTLTDLSSVNATPAVDSTTTAIDIDSAAVPTGLADSAIVNGVVNAARNLASQALTGRGSPNATITIYDGGARLGQTVADGATGAWSFTLGALADGTHSLTATATGIDGVVSAASAPLVVAVDATAPAAPIVQHVANAANAAYDAGFSVTAGAAATVTVNGVALTPAQLASAFAVSTGGGLDTYAAAPGAFAGAETIAVAASVADPAGNVSPAAPLTLRPIDTTPPAQPVIASETYSGSGSTGRWIVKGAAEAGSRVTVADGSIPLSTTIALSGSFSLAADSNVAMRVLTVTATDAAGNAGAPATIFDGTPGADGFAFASEAALSAAALINGAAGTDTLTMTAGATVTDADFAHVLSVEILGLTGASSVALGAKALAAGVTTVNLLAGASGTTSVADSNAGTLTVNAAGLGAGNTLALSGTTAARINGLAGALNAAAASGALTVTAAGVVAIAAGSGSLSVTDSAAGGSVAVDATALGAGQLTLAGSDAATVANLSGNVVATSLSGALNVTAVGAGPQSITTGTGATAIVDNAPGGGGVVNAAAMSAGRTLTLAGSAAETVSNFGGALAATGLSGALAVTTKTTSLSIATGSGPNVITAGLASGQTLTLTGSAAATVNGLGGNLAAAAYSGALTVATAGLAAQTITAGTGAMTITDGTAGTLTVNATAMTAGAALTLSGSGPITVTGLKTALNASAASGALTVTAAGVVAIAAGSGSLSVTDSAAGGSVAVDATALGIGQLTLAGSDAATVTNLSGNVVATSLSGALNVTAVGAGLQSVTTGTGATVIVDNAAGGGVVVNAAAMSAGRTLTLTGSAAATVNGLRGALAATGSSGALTVGTAGSAAQTITAGTGALTIADGTAGTLTVYATAMAASGSLTITGGGPITVTGLKATLDASAASGALTVTAAGTAAHSIQTGSGADAIVAAHGGDAIAAGGGGDAINVAGHSVADAFVYKAVSDSLNVAGGQDTIAGFKTTIGSAHDLLDFSAINPSLALQGSLAAGAAVNANSIAWLYQGGAAMIYANTTASALTTSDAGLMEVTLTGVSSGLTAANFRA